jgi:alpha-L-fucosidase 2
MILQCHKEYIEIFPAVPKDWHNISFKTLRTEGAFLISAKKGVATEVKIKGESGDELLVKLPFPTWLVKGIDRKIIQLKMVLPG